MKRQGIWNTDGQCWHVGGEQDAWVYRFLRCLSELKTTATHGWEVSLGISAQLEGEDKNLSQGHGKTVPRTEPEFWDYFTNRMNQVTCSLKSWMWPWRFERKGWQTGNLGSKCSLANSCLLSRWWQAGWLCSKKEGGRTTEHRAQLLCGEWRSRKMRRVLWRATNLFGPSSLVHSSRKLGSGIRIPWLPATSQVCAVFPKLWWYIEAAGRLK